LKKRDKEDKEDKGTREIFKSTHSLLPS